MTNDKDNTKRPQFSRRAALMKLGLAASAVYIAPAFTTLSTAQASGGSGGNSGGGNSGGSNSGPCNSGPSTSSPSGCESDSGCEDDS